MADGTVQLAVLSANVPEDVQAEIATVQGAIIDGSFAPFTGPINDQDGNEVVAVGVVVDLGALLGMDYFVEGVIGSATG